MPSHDEYPWSYYADLQDRSRKLPRLSDYAWGIESAMNFLLDRIETHTFPDDPDELVTALNRVIASAARLHRSRSVAASKLVPVAESPKADDPGAEARIEIARVIRLVSDSDSKVVLDAGVGYSSQEIAARNNTSPGAVRIRLLRARQKFAA